MNEPNMDKPNWKCQPVMIITDRGRLECCRCNALAIYMVVTRIDDNHSELTNWCQLCYEKASMEQGVQGE